MYVEPATGRISEEFFRQGAWVYPGRVGGVPEVGLTSGKGGR